MKKNSVRGYVVLAALLIVFSVISFVVPVPKTIIFWLAYVFGVFAILYQIYVFKVSFAEGGGAKSKFYGFPIVRIGIIYLIVQLIASLLEMIFQVFVPIWVVVIINVILGAMAVVGCIAADTMRDEIIRQDVQLKKDVSKMRALQSLSEALVSQCDEQALKAKLRSLADEFKYSDPVSCDETLQAEQDIAVLMDELHKSIIDNDNGSVETLCEKVSGCLSERNRICKLYK